MPNHPTWLNTDSAAAYLGITPGTLRRFVHNGEVVCYQIGRVRRYRLDDLDRFLDMCRMSPKAKSSR